MHNLHVRFTLWRFLPAFSHICLPFTGLCYAFFSLLRYARFTVTRGSGATRPDRRLFPPALPDAWRVFEWNKTTAYAFFCVLDSRGVGMNSVSPGRLGGPTRKAADRGSGAAEMQTLIVEKNWADTPLGPRETWPASLELSVALILSSGFPMAVRWGPELVSIYNDAYREILGEKHPGALGLPLREVWPEIYDQLGPLNEAILHGR